MAHLSENSIPLKEKHFNINIKDTIPKSDAVEFIILPYFKNLESIIDRDYLINQINLFIEKSSENSTVAILTSPIFAVELCSKLDDNAHLKLWIAVKLENSINSNYSLLQRHAALLILTKYSTSLRHTKTRIGYSYCPSCERTTKDYGGKKHLYHKFGTLMSDVWRDITVDYNNIPNSILKRLKDLFGLSEYKYINIYDQRDHFYKDIKPQKYKSFINVDNSLRNNSHLLNGDCVEMLKTIPDNSIDFCFADPPYNLKKKYEGWNDGIDIKKYFEWCDLWLSELARIIKPNRTIAILNIPQWCIRHYKYLIKKLDFQDWIVWEGLSMPVRMIMPAHYSILCFSKGKPRPLPGLYRKVNNYLEQKAITTYSENYCTRTNCIKNRKIQNINDTEIVSNLWWDIHRLKHNSRRVDHPCQLPPMLMYRLISIFTNQGEFVLDPFNGAGTTTLAAEQLGRKYIGIEISKYYHSIASDRHNEISLGIDPFRKTDDNSLKAKNSPVKRLKKQKYNVSKKDLQLEVKEIASELGRIPQKDDLIKLSKYPIDYYESYFINWGEVTAAARTTGMTEYKDNKKPKSTDNKDRLNGEQLKLFE